MQNYIFYPNANASDPTIAGKIYETMSRNQAILDRTRKLWNLFLRNLWPLVPNFYLQKHSSQRVFIPSFQIIRPPSLILPPLKNLYPPFPILFFQTLNVVMLIASAKSWSAREASHQPAVMVSCLTVSHMFA